jgi:hypothetical protein
MIQCFGPKYNLKENANDTRLIYFSHKIRIQGL